MPKVSVVIPTYNYGRFLKEAIDSVYSQTFNDFEVIVIDNQSTDNTYEVVKKYLERDNFKYVVNELNIPMAANWNKSLLLANGDYIKLLCADDILHTEHLEKLVKILDENNDVSLVSSYFKNFGSNEDLIKHPFVCKKDGKGVLKFNILFYNSIGTPSQVLFRRKHLWVGLFRTEYVWMIDADFWHRLLFIGNYYNIPEVLSYVRTHDKQATTSTWKDYTYVFDDYTYRKNLQFFNDFSVNEYRNELTAALRTKLLNIIDKVPRMLINRRFDLVFKAFRYAYYEGMVFKSLFTIFIISTRSMWKRVFKN